MTTKTAEAKYVMVANMGKDAVCISDILKFLAPGRDGSKPSTEEDDYDSMKLAVTRHNSGQ